MFSSHQYKAAHTSLAMSINKINSMWWKDLYFIRFWYAIVVVNMCSVWNIKANISDESNARMEKAVTAITQMLTAHFGIVRTAIQRVNKKKQTLCERCNWEQENDREWRRNNKRERVSERVKERARSGGKQSKSRKKNDPISTWKHSICQNSHDSPTLKLLYTDVFSLLQPYVCVLELAR